MKCRIILMAISLSLACGEARSQELPSRLEVDYFSFARLESFRTDTLMQKPVRRLLPENMSIMEKGVWGEDGFLRSAGIASPLTPQVRKSELSLRRTMLYTHQIGGFLTLASMLAAVYYGQKSLDDPNSGQRNDPYRGPHQTFVTTTIVLYSGTGLLAILSPPPSIRRGEWSTTTIHKTLAWVHVAGMVITPILGGMIGRHADALHRERIHQLSGYITLATFTASLVTITF